VDDVAEAELRRFGRPGIELYLRSEELGLPAGHVGFRVGVSNTELGITDRNLAPDGIGTGPGGTVT
jgi:hypothetical protein